MKIIVGLGNPGAEYQNNRHNAGFIAIDAFADYLSGREFQNMGWQKSKKAKALYLKFKNGAQTIELIKPQTLMNNSGPVVAYAKNKHKLKLDDIYILHDDLDIRLGEYKIQKGVGPKDHKGLLSIEKFLGKDFWRLRIGVDNRDATNRIPGEAYVLQNFNQNEIQILHKTLNSIVVELFSLITHAPKTLEIRN
jgi:PTH1 family peptidyl-tRNA hydrolase